jgi:quercetin dioxygenase-like cupin family protein
MRYAMHESEATRVDADVHALFGADRGCDVFTQTLVRVAAGHTAARGDGTSDEVFYVLAGAGHAACGGETHALAPGTSVFAAAGTLWEVAAGSELRAVSVLVHDPAPATRPFAVVDLAAAERGDATAGRQFVLGATPDHGCASVTQFLGLVPPGRAPDHFHTYDEVIYVLEGEGRLFIGGEEAELGPGSCVHLPARLVHSHANTRDTELRLLGVFRPAGSPAEAYYPDGTPAVVPERS